MLLGNILDYLDWRGDLNFRKAPFNEVDNLILASLSYLNLDGIVPTVEEEGWKTVEETAKEYFAEYSEEELKKDKSLLADTYQVLEKMAVCRRFSNAKLGRFRKKNCVEKIMQFAALHIVLDDGSVYISFRGTDDTLIGWKEDFSMSYRMPIPSQTEAVRYVNDTINDLERKYRMGGHSKGGNIAIYAGMECREEILKTIVKIYNNDGPGFFKSIVDDPKYQRIKNRIQTIVPETSIIGMMLEHDDEYTIVKSDKVGIMQHDGLSWKVVGDHFVELEHLSNDSMIINQTLRNWLSEIDDEKRQEFVNTIFFLLSSTGAQNVSEMNSDLLKNMSVIMKSLKGLDTQTQNMVHKLLKELTGQYGLSIKRFISRKKK